MNEEFSNRLMALQMGIVASLIAFAGARFLGFFTLPQRVEPHSPSLSLWDVIAIFFLFLLAEALVGPLLFYLVESWIRGRFLTENDWSDVVDNNGWVHVAAVTVSTAVVLLYTFILKPKTAKAYGLICTRPIKMVLIGASLWFLAYPLVVVLDQVIALGLLAIYPENPDIEQVAVQHLKNAFEHTNLFYSLMLLIVFAVPILEEILFRGFLQTWIREKAGLWWALLLTSAIFAGFHYSATQGMGNIEIIASLFLLSIILGYTYERLQSLWASIGLHASFNAASIAIIIWS